jgi:hypothetical protein
VVLLRRCINQETFSHVHGQQASNDTIYSGLSDDVRLPPVICGPFLELLGALMTPSPFGVSSHFG